MKYKGCIVKVLIVEDDELNQMVLSEMLNILFTDLEIEIESSAFSVLERDDLDAFDIILSDINMPKMDGMQLFSILKEERNFSKPILAITALAVDGERERILLHGFDGYIAKPIDLMDLQTTLTPYLKG